MLKEAKEEGSAYEGLSFLECDGVADLRQFAEIVVVLLFVVDEVIHLLDLFHCGTQILIVRMTLWCIFNYLLQ